MAASDVYKRQDEKLRAEPLVRRVDWSIGESPPEFYYNLRANVKGVPSWSRALVLTTDENQTDELIRRLQKEVCLLYTSPSPRD